MKPAAFAYAKAQSLDHAIALLGQEGAGARLLAGGQTLMATLNMRLSAPSLLVDINGIDGLDQITLKDGILEIGALVRQVSALNSELVALHAPLIAAALPHVGHPAIRNRGTIGGSIAYADPAAELPACLVALNGVVVASGPNGVRTIPADDFFLGLFETALSSDEILTAIRVPIATQTMRYGFAELARRHGDYALVGLAASARMDANALRDVRLAYFGIGATPLRAKKAETALAGPLDEARIEAAVAALDLNFEGDLHASAAVKQHLAGVLLKRVARQLKEPRA